MRTQFIHSFRWNIVEVLLYQGGLLLHQSLLFSHLSSSQYGAISTAFSTLYLLSHITNTGLDVAQEGSFHSFSQSKCHYRHFFITHILPTYSLLALFIAIGGLLGSLFSSFAPTTILILCVLLLSETAKRTAKGMAKLLFRNKQSTYTETIGLALYLACVWGGYSLGLPLTLNTTLWPLMAISLASTFYYGLIIYRWYHTLESSAPFPISPIPYSHRLSAWVFQWSKQLSSSNFLVTYLGLFVGLEQAGLVSMMCNLLYSINSITQHTIGSSFISLFVQSQDRKKSLDIVSSTTIVPAAIFFTFLWCIPILYASTNFSLPLAFVCAALACIEHLWVHHEKLFIAHQRTGHLIIASLALPLLIPFAIAYLQAPHALFTFFVTIRFASCCYLVYYAQSVWDLAAPRILLAASFILMLLTFTTR